MALIDAELQKALEDLYRPSLKTGEEALSRQFATAKTKALTDLARRGVYTSGYAEKDIAKKYGENYANALANLHAEISSQKAQPLWQSYLLNKQREWATQDFLRNTLFNLAQTAATPFVYGYGANILKNIAPDMYQALLDSMRKTGQAQGVFVPVISQTPVGGVPTGGMY